MRIPMKTLAALVVVMMTATSLAGQASRVRVDFKETRLKNGLRVVTVEDRSAPVVSLAVTYNVGSRNERKGRTGFAHLFEHMMFKGSANVGPGEHFVLILNNGGSMNGTTNTERTNYFETVPSNQLDLILFLEADRMRSLEITQENLDNQRNAVQEERRLGIDNQPYGKSGERLRDLLYDNFAYKHSTIGSMEDLNNATVKDVKDFFDLYYSPRNAVLTLVGDFETKQALEKIEKYFGDISRGKAPPSVDVKEPEQKAERRDSVDDPLAQLARIDIAYKAVPGNTPDFYALQVLSAVLQSGQSSRLYQKLVKEREMVTDVGGGMSESRGLGALYVGATVRPGVKTEDVEAAIYEEIEKLTKEPIADWEMKKAKNSIRRSFINSLQSSVSRAITLGQHTVYYDDPNLINTRLDKVDAVTKEAVLRVAKRFLRETNRTVVVTIPVSKVAGAARIDSEESSHAKQ